MNLLQNFSITARLTFLSFLTLIFLCLIGFLGMQGTAKSNASLQDIYENHLVAAGSLEQIIQNMQEMRAELLLGLQHEPASDFASMHNHPLEQHTDAIVVLGRENDKLWQDLNSTNLSNQEKALAQELLSKTNACKPSLDKVMNLLKQGNYAAANEELLFQYIPALNQVIQQANSLVNLVFKGAEEHFVEAEAAYATSKVINISMITLAVVLSLGITWATIQGITEAVDSLETVSQQMADGNLKVRSKYRGRDELGTIAAAFNAMGDKFSSTISQLGKATDQLNSAAQQAAMVSQQTGINIERQQQETEMVASAMNEMVATVQEVASSAENAADAASNADNEASTGTQVVGRTISAIENLANEVERAAAVIENLKRESEEVTGVLDVIGGIAEQTNLLALNAAIEAARAGEHGRGFAVVADEVRSLASRTQESTSEIQNMLARLQQGADNAVVAMQASQEQAQRGVEEAANAGTALNAITDAVNAISGLNAQIASAAEEQIAVAEEINRNLVNISEVAVETNEGSEQTAQASQQVTELAEQLKQLSGQFRT